MNMDKERYKRIIRFFDENPKAIILFVSCIKEAHYAQEIADEWFKEGSPIFSKEDTISKMLNEKLIELEKKEKKTHYYRTSASAISDVLMAFRLKKNHAIQKQFENEKENITTFFENKMILDFFDLKTLKRIFENSKSLEKHGIEYIDIVFLLRLYKHIFNMNFKYSKELKKEKLLELIKKQDTLFEMIFPYDNFKISFFFKKLLYDAKKDPECFYKNIQKLPKIETEIDKLQLEMIMDLMNLNSNN